MSSSPPANEDQSRPHRPTSAANASTDSNTLQQLDQNTENQNTDDQSTDIGQALQEVEQSFLQLKARHAQITLDHQRQQELQQQKSQIEFQLQHDRTPATQLELKRELKRIRKQIEELEVALESQLFSWNGLKEVFWLAIRFGGLGVVLGWILKSCAG